VGIWPEEFRYLMKESMWDSVLEKKGKIGSSEEVGRAF
jgi:hypothetical protein